MTEVTRELLTTLEPEDIEVAGISPARLEELAQETGHVKVTCPHTGKPMVIDDRQLGTEVQSEHCDGSFVADWGSPVLLDPEPAAASESAAAMKSTTSNEPEASNGPASDQPGNPPHAPADGQPPQAE